MLLLKMWVAGLVQIIWKTWAPKGLTEDKRLLSFAVKDEACIICATTPILIFVSDK